MTADPRRALRALIVGDGATPFDSDEAARRIWDAGWRPVPQPGSPEWEEMEGRAFEVFYRNQNFGGPKGRTSAALRAALDIEEPSNG